MTTNKTVTGDPNFLLTATKILFFNDFNNFDKSSARISLHLLPGFEFLKIKSVLYDTDNTPKNVTDGSFFTFLLFYYYYYY